MRALIVAISLTVNLALIIHLRARPTMPPAQVSGPRRVVTDGPATPRSLTVVVPPAAGDGNADPTEAIRAASAAAAMPSIPVPTKAPRWEALAAASPEEFVAMLSAAGWSQPDIRAALEAKFAGEFDARRKEMEAAAPGNPYWQYPSSVSEKRTELSAAQLRDLRDLARSQAKTLDQVAGADGLPAMPPSFDDQRRFDGIPPEKVPFVRMIEEDYGDLATVAKRDQAIFPFPEDAQRLQMVSQEKDKDLKEILTPEEFEEYNVRNSTTADWLRNELVAFQPSEAEFRLILARQEANAAQGKSRDDPNLKADIVTALGGRGPAYEQAIVPAARTAWIKAQAKK